MCVCVCVCVVCVHVQMVKEGSGKSRQDERKGDGGMEGWGNGGMGGGVV